MHNGGPAAVKVVHAACYIQCYAYAPLIIELQRAMLLSPVPPKISFSSQLAAMLGTSLACMGCWDVQIQLYMLHHRHDDGMAASAHGATRLVILQAWTQKCKVNSLILLTSSYRQHVLPDDIRTDAEAMQEHAVSLQNIQGSCINSVHCQHIIKQCEVGAPVQPNATHAIAVSCT